MADVVAEARGFGQRRIQTEPAGDGDTDLGDLEGVREARDVVVALRVHEDLGFVFETAECLRVEDAVAVSLEAGSPGVRLLWDGTSDRVGRKCCARRENSPFLDLRYQAVSEHEPVHC